MDREHGATEACAFVKKLDFAPSAVAFDAASGQIVAPNGSIGFRWGEEGKWNLEQRAKGAETQLRLSQIMEGDLARHIEAFADITAHVQIAGVPERHEPDVGEINYPYLFEVLDRVGYRGWVGCEYRPRGRTEDGLGWFAPYRRR